jgi:hypothetical protein
MYNLALAALSDPHSPQEFEVSDLPMAPEILARMGAPEMTENQVLWMMLATTGREQRNGKKLAV